MLGIEHWLGYPYGTDGQEEKLTPAAARQTAARR
jgi:hypothetical protein